MEKEPPTLDDYEEKSSNDAFLFFSYLDEIEDRIGQLRRGASALSQERDSLLLILKQLKEESMQSSLTKDEFEEMCANMARLRARCESVDIKVQIIRNKEQQKAFAEVDALVDSLEQSCSITDQMHHAIRRAESYLNACSSDYESSADSRAIDYKFQGKILDCVMEDQKFIRVRLQNIVRNNQYPSSQGSQSKISASSLESKIDNCIKPSDIAASVKENPYCEDLSGPLSVSDSGEGSTFDDGVSERRSYTGCSSSTPDIDCSTTDSSHGLTDFSYGISE